MYYLIKTKKGKVLSTDLPEDLIKSGKSYSQEFSSSVCEIRRSKKREGLIENGNIQLYLCCYDQNKTNKIFRHQLTASKGFLKAYVESYKNMAQEERKKARRLKHNLSTYHSKIHQELFKLIPQEKVSGSKGKQREIVKSILEKKMDHTVTTFLRVLKNAHLIKSEFDVYDLMHNPNPHIDKQTHSIHKVVTLSLSSFWLDFLDKEISIGMDDCLGEMQFDYKSMSSILCHIFDNATKYVANNSELLIRTSQDNHYYYLIFDMISLRVKDEELKKIFDDGFSSDFSEKLGYAGTGVGMNVIKRLSELNGFKLEFKNNVDPTKSFEKMGIPFDQNVLSIGIPKKSS